MRVFISSTAKDLAVHRQAVDLAIERLRQDSERMEAWVAAPDSSVTVCIERATKADLLVVVVAHRYGWVPAPEQGGDGEKSITWLEVEAAERAGKPVLAFLVKPDHPWTHGKEQDDLVDARPSQIEAIFHRVQGLQELKKYLASKRVVSYFTTPDSLGAQVTAALALHLRGPEGRAPAPGLGGYLEALESETAFIPIQGIGVAPGMVQGAARYRVEALYTPLRSRDVLLATDATADTVMLERGAEVDLAALLPRHPRLLIEGQPGAGKTTFLKLVACMLARDRLAMPGPDGLTWSARYLGLKGAVTAPLPVLLKLDEIAAYAAKDEGAKRSIKERTILDVLAGRAVRDGLAIDAGQWQELLTRGDVTLLLDGLDEVADPTLRGEVIAVVGRAAQAWPKVRMVVTSRPFDTEPLVALGFQRASIEPFDLRAIHEFLRRWVSAVHHEEDLEALTPQARDYLTAIEAAIPGNPRIRRMAANPVMLTCLAVIHWNEGRLPEGKARVYRAVIRWLLRAREKQRSEHGVSEHFAWKAFARLALAMMGPGPKEAKRATLDLAAAAQAVDDVVAREWPQLGAEDRGHKARAWLRFECAWSGILEEVSANKLRFWHLTFQEYLAALQLAWWKDDVKGTGSWWPVVQGRLRDAQWRETIDLLPGCLLDVGGDERVDTLLDRALEEQIKEPGLKGEARAAGVVGRFIEHVVVYGYRTPRRIDERYRKALDKSLAIFTDDGAKAVPWQERIAAAEALGQAGDPRLADFRRNLLAIPGRPSLLLGKYPVTVREYLEFVDDRGYEQERFWSNEGWAKMQGEGWNAPDDWDAQVERPNRPVVSVLWYEAEAYCRWRKHVTGLAVRLPTEAEWYAAAKHPDGDYPWGGEEPTEERANFGMNVSAPTPVGMYPAGAGPGGHLDLAGNVWEWCSDEVDPDGSWPGRALRGGGWFDAAEHLRPAYRYEFSADERHDVIGFRVVVEAASTVAP